MIYVLLIIGVLVIVLFPAVYYGMIVASLDPHNPLETANKWGLCLKVFIAIFALLATFIFSSENPKMAVFWGSFFLGQVISPVFTGGDRYRRDEEPNALKRMWLYWQSVFAGAVLLKLLCVGLFFTTHWLLGEWWFILVLAIAFHLVIARIVTANILLSTLTAEQVLDRTKDPIEQVRRFKVTSRRGVIGFFVCVGCAATVFGTVELPPFSWWSWSGVLIGATSNVLNEI